MFTVSGKRLRAPLASETDCVGRRRCSYELTSSLLRRSLLRRVLKISLHSVEDAFLACWQRLYPASVG